MGGTGGRDNGRMSHAGQRRRESFDTVADLYHAGRRGYPPAVVGLVVEAVGIRSGSKVLEIGPGTGQLSVELCRAGAELVAVELGPNLARVAREHLVGFPTAQVVTAAFEDWPLPPAPFDGVCSATAFHWLDPAVRFDKCAAALRPGGVIAIVHSHHVRGGTEDFFRQSNSLYFRYGLSDQPDFELPRLADLPPTYPELEDHPAFDSVRRQRVTADLVFDSSAHVGMLRTDSLIITLDEPDRSAFLAEIADLIDSRYHGTLTRSYAYEIVTATRHHAQRTG
jgi:SAM-dependent methyltransferase